MALEATPLLFVADSELETRLTLQKSSIGGNQYLAYLWESGWLSLYI
jgi:hypothetical protein